MRGAQLGEQELLHGDQLRMYTLVHAEHYCSGPKHENVIPLTAQIPFCYSDTSLNYKPLQNQICQVQLLVSSKEITVKQIFPQTSYNLYT